MCSYVQVIFKPLNRANNMYLKDRVHVTLLDMTNCNLLSNTYLELDLVIIGGYFGVGVSKSII